MKEGWSWPDGHGHGHWVFIMKFSNASTVTVTVTGYPEGQLGNEQPIPTLFYPASQRRLTEDTSACRHSIHAPTVAPPNTVTVIFTGVRP
jgi:hypothetical protein